MDEQSVPGRWQRLAAQFYYWRGALHRHIGNLQGDREEYRLAVADLTRAIERNPASTQTVYERGVLLWRELDDGVAAAADMTRVLELEPGRSEALFNRAFARQVAGDVPGALADFQRYLEEGHDPMWLEISRQQIEGLLALQAVVQEEEE